MAQPNPLHSVAAVPVAAPLSVTSSDVPTFALARLFELLGGGVLLHRDDLPARASGAASLHSSIVAQKKALAEKKKRAEARELQQYDHQKPSSRVDGMTGALSHLLRLASSRVLLPMQSPR